MPGQGVPAPQPEALPHERAAADSTGLRPLPPTPKEDLAVSNMRVARSDCPYEHLDEEFNPTNDVEPR